MRSLVLTIRKPNFTLYKSCIIYTFIISCLFSFNQKKVNEKFTGRKIDSLGM